MTSSANGDGAEGFPAIVGPVGEQNLLHPDFSLGKSKRVQVQTNVNYIAAGIVLRGDGDNLEVCLVQEAKEDCYGLWYMPAGRIERGESLSDGVKREILEESGLEVTVDDLTSVEVQGGGWYRFTFCCTATGGSLKTTADKESLSAQWFSVSDVIQRKMKLRSKDMLTVVNNAVDYHRQRNSEQAILRPRISVIEENVAGMYLRLLIMRRKNGRMELLASKDTVGVGHDSLPLVEFPLNCYVAAAISKFYREVLIDGSSALSIPTRCIGVQCLPTPQDGASHGLCLTLLCMEKPRMNSKPSRPERYHWAPVDDPVTAHLLTALESQGPVFHLS